MKNFISKQDLHNFYLKILPYLGGGGGGGSGGSGGGSLFVITTDDPELYGETVTITDEEYQIFTGEIDDHGYCTISGVTSTGHLMISSPKAFSDSVDVTYYSKYKVILKLAGDLPENTDFDTAYNYANAMINAGMVTYEHTFEHALMSGDWDFYISTDESTTANIKDFGYDQYSRRIKGGPGSFTYGNLTASVDGNAAVTFTFNKGGIIVLSYEAPSNRNTMPLMRQLTDVFSVKYVTPGETLYIPVTGIAVRPAMTFMSYYSST